MSGLWLGTSGLALSTGLYSGTPGLALGTGLYVDGVVGYTITIPGAVITGDGPGVFDETTGLAGTIATASTDLPDLGSGFTWSVVAGSDARIGVVSADPGQGSTMGVTASSGIYSGDSADFILRVTNGTIAIEFPFTAVGTAASARILLESSGALLLESGSYVLLEV